MKSRGEFGFIDYVKANFPAPEATFGIGDDCAVMPAGGGELLFSTDLLMEGVHFLRNESSPEDVGWKAAAVNLSDIAAMGGTPVATSRHRCRCNKNRHAPLFGGGLSCG